MVKRIAGTVVTAGAFVMWSASTALAQTSYPPSPRSTTSVEGTSGGGTTAFTGGRIGFAVVAIAVLLALGLAASVIARRRSAGVGN